MTFAKRGFSINGFYFVLLTVATLSISTTVFAVEKAVDPLLGLDDAVRISLERNHDILTGVERINELDGLITETKSAAYPHVGLSALYSRSYDESILDVTTTANPSQHDYYSLKATLDQLLFSWGKVSGAIDLAKLTRRQAEEELSARKRTLKLAVHEAYYSLLLSNRLVEVAEETLAQRRDHLEIAGKKFNAGVVNEFEVVRARVALANAKPPVIRAHNRVARAVAKLNHLMARPQDTPVEPLGALYYNVLEIPTLAEAVAKAKMSRPELASLRIFEAMAEKTLTIYAADNMPTLNFHGEYGYATKEFEELGAKREHWQAAVTLDFPFFDGFRTRGLVAQAESETRQARILISQLNETIALEAKFALDQLVEAERIYEAATENIEEAKKGLELAKVSYKYGVGTSLDVTDARLGLTQAQINLAQSLHGQMVARARLSSVMHEL